MSTVPTTELNMTTSNGSKLPCGICKKLFKMTTLVRNHGVCGRCDNKQISAILVDLPRKTRSMSRSMTKYTEEVPHKNKVRFDKLNVSAKHCRLTPRLAPKLTPRLSPNIVHTYSYTEYEKKASANSTHEDIVDTMVDDVIQDILASVGKESPKSSVPIEKHDEDLEITQDCIIPTLNIDNHKDSQQEPTTLDNDEKDMKLTQEPTVDELFLDPLTPRREEVKVEVKNSTVDTTKLNSAITLDLARVLNLAASFLEYGNGKKNYPVNPVVNQLWKLLPCSIDTFLHPSSTNSLVKMFYDFRQGYNTTLSKYIRLIASSKDLNSDMKDFLSNLEQAELSNFLRLAKISQKVKNMDWDTTDLLRRSDFLRREGSLPCMNYCINVGIMCLPTNSYRVEDSLEELILSEWYFSSNQLPYEGFDCLGKILTLEYLLGMLEYDEFKEQVRDFVDELDNQYEDEE